MTPAVPSLVAMAHLDDLAAWFRNRDRDLFDAFAQGAEAPTDDEVVEFEQRLGFALPPEVRELGQHQLGGLLIEAKDTAWPRPQRLAVGPAWSFQYGLQVYSLSDGAPDWLQMRVAREDLLLDFPDRTDLVPVLKVTSDPAPWVSDEHGTLLKLYRDGLEPMGFEGGFYDLVLEEIRQLELRVQRKLAGEG